MKGDCQTGFKLLPKISTMLAHHFNTHDAISIGKKYAVKVVKFLCVTCCTAIRNMQHINYTSI
jgi:hypothetical protein